MPEIKIIALIIFILAALYAIANFVGSCDGEVVRGLIWLNCLEK